ncbi:hypothetical protein V144x_52340 [Gimesia aquarii]|uniref:Uncharacterized protein n=1 Tax=Gimesia aquarii TaxID=2527964 RepID=A0A517W381_9PLAN|nr:hypothetical protein V144x_52340 [Gimesia aquarii]
MNSRFFILLDTELPSLKLRNLRRARERCFPPVNRFLPLLLIQYEKRALFYDFTKNATLVVLDVYAHFTPVKQVRDMFIPSSKQIALLSKHFTLSPLDTLTPINKIISLRRCAYRALKILIEIDMCLTQSAEKHLSQTQVELK